MKSSQTRTIPFQQQSNRSSADERTIVCLGYYGYRHEDTPDARSADGAYVSPATAVFEDLLPRLMQPA